jgi:elongation factor Ts
MEINATDVKKLRDMTGAGMMEAKKALTETGGDMEKAADFLRERGAAIAASKLDRVAANGVVASYIHNGSRVGVLVEVMVETDFVARDEKFGEFAKQIALHIAGMNPKYLSEDQVPTEEKDQAKDLALLSQPFVLDSSKTVGQLVTENIATFKENIQIGHFARFELGAPAKVC